MKARNTIVTAALLPAAAAVVLATACSEVNHVFKPSSPKVVYGDGTVLEESRAISGVNRVTLAGVGDLYIRQGAQEELLVRAEANLLEHIRTDVQGGELRISKGGASLLNTQPIEYHLTVTTLERAALTGAGRIEASHLDTGELTLLLSGVGDIDFADLTATRVEVESSGVGDVRASGSVSEQTIKLKGLGDYDGAGLASAEADVRIARSGSATVRVRDHLTATINGSGSVYYIGSPTVDSTISGSGQVVNLGS